MIISGKMANWHSVLQYNPITPLLSSENKAVAFFTARDFLGNVDKSPEILWDLPEVQKIVKKQQHDGSWKYPGGNKNIRSQENYDQIETYRNLGYLVEMYGFDKSSSVITRAADFLFRFQTDKGDIRGIYGNQYTPNYTAGILELLIKAGYAKDPRIERALQWLTSMRQNDGGWAIPIRTLNKSLYIITTESKTLEPDRSQPFSHLVTGVVLRAFAAHRKNRNSYEAKEAGKLLLSHLFKKDNYADRVSPDYWLRFTFPFWFTDLISAMDSLSILGFPRDEPQIEKAVQWFVSHQQINGLWKLRILKNNKYMSDFWLSVAICRIIERLYDEKM